MIQAEKKEEPEKTEEEIEKIEEREEIEKFRTQSQNINIEYFKRRPVYNISEQYPDIELSEDLTKKYENFIANLEKSYKDSKLLPMLSNNLQRWPASVRFFKSVIHDRQKTQELLGKFASGFLFKRGGEDAFYYFNPESHLNEVTAEYNSMDGKKVAIERAMCELSETGDAFRLFRNVAFTPFAGKKGLTLFRLQSTIDYGNFGISSDGLAIKNFGTKAQKITLNERLPRIVEKLFK